MQDMGLLEIDLPPIQLHASTQTDIRTPEKARFLQDVGFSKIVLARELTLEQIEAIRAQADSRHAGVLRARRAVRRLQRPVLHQPRPHRAQRQPRRLLAGLPPAVPGDRRAGPHRRARQARAVDEGQRPERQPRRAGRRRHPQLQDRGPLQGPGLRQERHRPLPAADRCTCSAQRAGPEARVFGGARPFAFTPDPQHNFNRERTDYFVNGRRDDLGAFDTPKHPGRPSATSRKVGARRASTSSSPARRSR